MRNHWLEFADSKKALTQTEQETADIEWFNRLKRNLLLIPGEKLLTRYGKDKLEEK
jgi:hypothetical protein